MRRPAGLNQTPIPYDSRLNRWARRNHEATITDRKVAEIALEVGTDLPSTQDIRHAQATLPGDPWKLRGIPAVGGRGNLGGHIPGTRPDQRMAA